MVNTTYEKMPDTSIYNLKGLEHCKQITAESLDLGGIILWRSQLTLQRECGLTRLAESFQTNLPIKKRSM